MSKLQVCADWSRPSPSSPKLPVLGSVQSDRMVGPDRTGPYPRPGSSGLVESLLAREYKSQGPIKKTFALMAQIVALHSYNLGKDHPLTLASMDILAQWNDKLEASGMG